MLSVGMAHKCRYSWTIRQKVLLYAPPMLGIEPKLAQQSGKHFCPQVPSPESPALLKPVAMAQLPFAISFYPVSLSE